MDRNNEGVLIFDFEDVDDRQEAFNMLMELPSSKNYLEHYDPIKDRDEHADLIMDAVDTLYGEAVADGKISVRQLELGLKTLIKSGAISFSKEEQPVLEAPAVPVVDATPRDRAGRALTESQLAWGEMTKFANESSMDAINQRKYVDPQFRAFMATNMRREMQEQVVADGVENLNANRTPQAESVPDDVRAYAVRYRTLSVSDARKELSPGMNPLGPEAARKANQFFEAACAANLI